MRTRPISTKTTTPPEDRDGTGEESARPADPSLAEEIRIRDGILHAVSLAAKLFLSPEEDLDPSVQVVLARLGEATAVSRVYVFRNLVDEAGDLVTTLAYEWTAPGISPQIDQGLEGLSYEELGFRRWEKVLGDRGTLQGNVDDFPPDEREFLESQDIRSLVVVPIFAGGEWWGFMGFDDCWSERDWTREIAQPLAAAADILGSALHRRSVEASLRAREAELRQAQKMEAVGSLAGAVAHDFNNVLTAIKGRVSLLVEELPDDRAFQEDAAEILKSAEHAAELTRQLLAFGRRQVLRPAVLDLNEVVRDSWRLLRSVVRAEVSLELDLDPELESVKADRMQIEQVLMNLVLNARDAIQGRGTITVRTRNEEMDRGYVERHAYVVPGPYVMLSVVDDGAGMTREVRERIFEPFFTTKDPGRGTGLGLASVFGIVKQSGGYLWVYSEPAAGATFKMYLPRVDESPAEAAPEKTGRGAVTGSETVLVVDDDPGPRSTVARILHRQGYTVMEAEGGREALALVRGLSEPIHLVVSDVVMPEMGGPELVAVLRERQPGLRALFTSGYSRESLDPELFGPGTDFLEKPFSLMELARAVRDVLDR